MSRNPAKLSELAAAKIRAQMAECGKLSSENLKKLPLPKPLQELVERADDGGEDYDYEDYDDYQHYSFHDQYGEDDYCKDDW